jgi:Ca-activated chloride channel family protein
VSFRVRSLCVAAALVLVSGLVPAASQQQPPIFRAGTELVSLAVTVMVAGTPRYITGLETTDFEVFEDGVKQEISIFNNTNSPIALTFLLDTSASMDTRLHTAQEAAIGFARTIRQQDLAEIIDFDSRAIVLQRFTSEVDQLERAIRKTSAGGTTSMFNAIYIALDELKRLPPGEEHSRRKAIVLLSDGEDTTSMLEFEGPDGILELVKRSDAVIYAVGLRPPQESRANTFKRSEFVLRQLAQQTGGRVFFPAHINELANVYGQIADELSNQYIIGYTSKNTRHDGTWRRIVVRANRPNSVVRTKQGYAAPAR